NVWGSDTSPNVLRKVDSIALFLADGGLAPAEIADLLDETKDPMRLKADRWRKRIAWARKKTGATPTGTKTTRAKPAVKKPAAKKPARVKATPSKAPRRSTHGAPVSVAGAARGTAGSARAARNAPPRTAPSPRRRGRRARR